MSNMHDVAAVTRFQGKAAMVVGGASGIGAEISKLLAAEGARVAVVDRNRQGAHDVVAGLETGGLAVECDITSPASVDAAVGAVSAEFGSIQILVNCAGVATLLPAEELPIEDWDTMMAINLRGAFLTCQAVGRLMIAGSGGRIVNIASQAGTVAMERHVAYCASKFGLVGMTKVLAAEWGPSGVTVNAVSPTVVLTELGKSFWDGPHGEEMKQQIPTRRFALPEEVAAAVLFLASDDAGMINGADLLIDGGFTIV
jgi:D-threitol dehydrogenase (NAD+)